MDIIEIAHGRFKPMSLEDRLRKASENVLIALEDGIAGGELDRSLDITGRQYLQNQYLLLIQLLESESW